VGVRVGACDREGAEVNTYARISTLPLR